MAVNNPFPPKLKKQSAQIISTLKKVEKGRYPLTEQIFQNAKRAAYNCANLPSDVKNNAVKNIAAVIKQNAKEIIEANKIDLENAKKTGISAAMLDRLRFDEKKIDAVVNSLFKVAALPDPVGTGTVQTRPNGLEIQKVRTPLGVVGIIFEARPNVTVDAASLCLKTGNACILRGGKEAVNTNVALGKAISQACVQSGVDEFAVQVVSDTSRDSANALMTANGYVDVLIPRGGKGLINSVVKNATVPVIETGAGNCHVYVDRYADLDMALKITDNAKNQRPSVCNAAESLLVHSKVAHEFLPKLKKLFDERKTELRGCDRTLEILPGIAHASDEDFYTEYNDYIMSVKIVDSVQEAVAHINEHSTHHSETIITENMQNAQFFTQNTDSAAVYVNASTRFTDGEEFGLGAEIGIATQKLHARGPMGLEALTTVKYIVHGNGQIRN